MHIYIDIKYFYKKLWKQFRSLLCTLSPPFPSDNILYNQEIDIGTILSSQIQNFSDFTCSTYTFEYVYFCAWGFPGSTVLKNLPANAGDVSSIPGLGRSLEKEMATHSSILAWEILWTKEPGGLRSTGSPRAGHNWAGAHTHVHTHTHTW